MKVLAFCLLATCVLSEIAHAEPPGQLLSQGGAGTYVRPYFAMYKDLATGLTMRYEQGQSIPNDQFPYFGTVDYKVQQVKRTLIGTFDAFQFFVVQDIDNQLDLTFWLRSLAGPVG